MRRCAYLMLTVLALFWAGTARATIIVTAPGVTCAADTQLVAPSPGQDCLQSTDGQLYRWTGSAWSSASTTQTTGKGRQVYNVRAHGVIGDGRDEGAAIQAVVDLIPSSGGTLYFPPTSRCYGSAQTLNFTNRKWIKISGAGSGNTESGTATLCFSGLGGLQGHGLDLAGADSFVVENLNINHTGGTPAAGIFMARTSVAAGGGHHFRDVHIAGTWAFGIYSYGTELNTYNKVTVSLANIPVLINAANPRGYTSRFATVATGGQSNTTHTFIDPFLVRTSTAASDGYQGALAVDDASDLRIYGGLLAAGPTGTGATGYGIHFKTNASAVLFSGVRFEENGAASIFLDGMTVNGLTVIGGSANGDNSVGAGVSAFLKKGPAGGSVQGLTVAGFGVGAFTGTSGNVFADLTILDNAFISDLGATTVTIATRFGGVILGIESFSQLALPADQQGLLHARSNQTRVLGTANFVGTPRAQLVTRQDAAIATLGRLVSVTSDGDSVEVEWHRWPGQEHAIPIEDARSVRRVPQPDVLDTQ